MLDGFSSFSNDKADLVPGNVHLEEATPSTVCAAHAGWTTLLPAALVGDDTIDGRFGSTKNKITETVFYTVWIQKLDNLVTSKQQYHFFPLGKFR